MCSFPNFSFSLHIHTSPSVLLFFLSLSNFLHFTLPPLFFSPPYHGRPPPPPPAAPRPHPSRRRVVDPASNSAAGQHVAHAYISPASILLSCPRVARWAREGDVGEGGLGEGGGGDEGGRGGVRETLPSRSIVRRGRRSWPREEAEEAPVFAEALARSSGPFVWLEDLAPGAVLARRSRFLSVSCSCGDAVLAHCC